MISAASAASDSDGRAAAERSMDVALDAAVHTRRPNRVKGSRYDHSAATANVPRIADDFWQRSKSTESGQKRPSTSLGRSTASGRDKLAQKRAHGMRRLRFIAGLGSAVPWRNGTWRATDTMRQ